VDGGTNIGFKASKLAFSDIDRNQRPAKPEEPMCRSRHWAVKKARTA